MNSGTPSQWKSYLLQMDDTAFFNLMRNYIGAFETPFHKPDLVEQLTGFLSHPENRQAILQRLDREDRILLTAVSILENPTPAQLLEIFSGTAFFRELKNRLVNLEERLLLFPLAEGRIRSYRINPLLAEDAAAAVLSPAELFESQPAPPDENRFPWLNDSLLAAFVSFSLENGNLYKNDGALKKQAARHMEEIWGDFFQTPGRLETLLTALTGTGVLEEDHGTFRLQWEAWQALAQAPPADRWARIYHLLTQQGSRQRGSTRYPHHPPGRNSRKAGGNLNPRETQEWERLIRGIPRDQTFTEAGLDRLIRTQCPSREAAPIRRALTEAGLLSCPSEGICQKAGQLPWSTEAALQQEQPLLVQPNYECTARPWLPLDPGYILAAACRITAYNLFPRYSLTKDTYMRSRDMGLSRSQLQQALEELNRAPLPSGIDSTFSSWEGEYNSLALYRGIVLTIAPERRALADHNEEFRRYILQELAPGVYWMDPKKEETWRKILIRGGFESVPAVREPDTPAADKPSRREPVSPSPQHPLPRESSPEEPQAVPSGAPEGEQKLFSLPWQPPQPVENSPEELRNRLLKIIKESSWDDEKREELTDRVLRGVILREDQMTPGLIRREKRQARGLDYPGKVRLIEQTLVQPEDQLEVTCRDKEGQPESFVLRPLELSRHGSDLILEGKDEEEQIRTIRVRKIASVRRISYSVFS